MGVPMNQDLAPSIDLPSVHPLYPGSRPTWEIAMAYPAQGHWTPEEYFALEDHVGGAFRAELVDGCLEVLPMPKTIHQVIGLYLIRMLLAWVEQKAPGFVSYSGLRVRVANGASPRFREPDVLYVARKNETRVNEDFSDGADLVMEVVSDDPKDKKRDYESKVEDYAAAGIAEYWIVDPQARLVRVLTLDGGTYRIHGDFTPGQEASSVLLPGFTLKVDAILKGKDQ